MSSIRAPDSRTRVKRFGIALGAGLNRTSSISPCPSAKPAAIRRMAVEAGNGAPVALELDAPSTKTQRTCRWTKTTIAICVMHLLGFATKPPSIMITSGALPTHEA